ncbi:MAG: TonB family protein [Pseudorhodobacter sp.]
MIASSRLAKLLALGLAISAHASMALMMPPPEEAEMEGQSGGIEARLGSSFADLAAGVETAREAPDRLEPVTPETVAATSTAKPLAPKTPVAARPPDPTPHPSQPASEQIAALQPAPTPPQPVDPSVAQKPELETLQAEPEPPVSSPKPRQRPARAQPPAQTQPKEQPRGNSNSNARAGQQDGKEKAPTTSSGVGGQKRETGNAAASNYPGLVMRKLSRVPRPRVGARGAAVIAFQVSANGGLAAVSLARSSGSGELDRAALRLVKRAAPFPKPPAGAQRSFSIQIKGR